MTDSHNQSKGDLTSEVDEIAGLARRMSAASRHDEAAELLLLALRLDPVNLAVKLALAEVRKLQQIEGGGDGRSRSLREVLREGFRRNAIDAAHFLGLAHLYAERGENGSAVDCLEVARQRISPTPPMPPCTAACCSAARTSTAPPPSSPPRCA